MFQNFSSTLGIERDFSLNKWCAKQLDHESLPNILIREILSNANVREFFENL